MIEFDSLINRNSEVRVRFMRSFLVRGGLGGVDEKKKSQAFASVSKSRNPAPSSTLSYLNATGFLREIR